ncbi:MAG TPA: argininosuccinate lyase [Eubacteriales bacterium]|jgi:argininosuccinate lyase|nr:argininosuccinate lyase [Eubacteriales bacterium]HRU83955.1 argininosuccinate lyase [Eubacteriales bacterium]
MSKNDTLWQGRFKEETDACAFIFNASLGVDKRLYAEDIAGSLAHAAMLKKTGIISEADADKIIAGLKEILAEIESGKLVISGAEDIHTFVEAELTKKIGPAGGKLHTARSRNDQAATDTKLYALKEINEIKSLIFKLLGVIYQKAEEGQDVIMPGYTHLQRAQPILLAHHLLAYAEMFKRDFSRLSDAAARASVSPLGAAALAGTTYPVDRKMCAEALGFLSVASNSIDAVSDRDYVIELASAIALIMSHLSRFSEEIVLWSSAEFGFLELSDAYSTGSSIMPQKKNPDIAELVRGKSGRAVGNLVALFTVMKGLPLAYNKDMQEDKELLFDSVDTVKACLDVFAGMLATSKFQGEKMAKAAKTGFLNATDISDYLAKKGLPFREAYKITGRLVAYCIENRAEPEALTLETLKQFSELFESDVYASITLASCVNSRSSEGGTSPASVKLQLAALRRFLDDTTPAK